jgi:hypothetical protein
MKGFSSIKIEISQKAHSSGDETDFYVINDR